MTEYGRFADMHGLLDIIRQRQIELGLSNAALDAMCDWPGGVVDKYLGPSRTKTPGMFALFLLLNALGLSGTLYVDERKAARRQKDWDSEGQRCERAVRPPARVSKALVARAAPVVMAEMGRRGAMVRWQGIEPSERAAHVAAMNKARLAIHRKRLGAKRR